MKILIFINLLSGTLGQLVNQFVSVVPRLVMTLLIIIVGIIVSKMVAKFVKKILEKIQIDRLGDKLNEIEIVDKAKLQIKFSSLLSKIIYYLMLAFFAVMATDVLDMPAISNLVTRFFDLIPSLIVALFILVLGTLFAEELRKIVQNTLDSLRVPSARLISTFVFYFMFINIALTALKQAKIDTAFLQQNISLLIGGIVLAFAIGYGLASKSNASNFLASFYTSGKIKIGDRITVDGTSGEVLASDKSTITLKTNNKSTVIIPLQKLTQEKIEIHNL